MSTINLETFSGSHYEIGIQQGKATRELIHRALEQLPSFEEVKLIKPSFLPMSLFLRLAKRRATKLLRNDIFQHYPKQAERLRGIAEGAGTDVSWMFFAQSMELLVTVGPSSYRIPACTSLGFNPQRTLTSETIVAKNFDYPNHFSFLHLTCNTKPIGGYQTLGCTMAPLPGMIDGMNEHGLTITYNLAYSTDEAKHFAPLSIVLQEMLETCRSTDEAVEFLTKAKRAGSGLLMVADAECNIKAVEISHNYASVRNLVDDQIINTNHYQTLEMQKHEIPHNAVLSGKVPKDWLGKRVHESSEQRLKRAQELLNSKEKMDENEITTILGDHGQNKSPSNLTICQHGAYISTLRSLIFYPDRKTIKVLYGNTCQNEYVQFGFS